MNFAGAAPTLLVATAVGTALFHTLIPDHWLPFVLIALAQRWTGAKTALWTGLSALIHIGLSILLGLIGIALGRGTALLIGGAFEKVSGFLLLLFGLGYAVWARMKGGHFHVGGELAHRVAAGGAEHDRPHRIVPRVGETVGGSHHGVEDIEEVDEDLIRPNPGGRGPLFLAMIIGLNPCVLVLPLIMKSPEYGPATLIATAAAYGVATLAMMVGLTFFAVSSGRRIHMPFLHRYGEMASGIGIALVGACFLFLEH